MCTRYVYIYTYTHACEYEGPCIHVCPYIHAVAMSIQRNRKLQQIARWSLYAALSCMRSFHGTRIDSCMLDDAFTEHGHT
jgi:hypothetical protein